MPSLIDSQEAVDWDGLMVVMALKIAGYRAARQPHVIDRFELLGEQAKVSVPLLAHWTHTPRPPHSAYRLGQDARPIARGPGDSLAAGPGLRV
jgi:hypothetical protein